MDAIYIIGQILGIIAVVMGFISFQMKSPKGILIFQVITALVFFTHYWLIKAPTAMALNLIAAIQCIFYYFRDKRKSNSLAEPIFFTILTFVMSIITWDGWYSAFIMLGLTVNSVSLAFSDAQKIRISMFIKSPACLLYNALVGSGGGTIYECAVLISSLIGTIRNKNKSHGVD